MSTSLEKYLREKRQNKDLLLMTHVVCGYPSFEDNYKELQIMADAGVEMVELQFPFSEPSADGPLFVKANQVSIENGTTVAQCLAFMKKISADFPFKVLMMGYYNTAYKMGHAKYIANLKEAGACGFILPDLPIEEAGELHAIARENDMAPILLMTPTNTDKRLKALGENAEGFIYAVARKGVTGPKTKMGDELEGFLTKCRNLINVPLAVGFGISTAEDIAYLKGKGDIAIIGTAALRAWETGREVGLKKFFSDLLK